MSTLKQRDDELNAAILSGKGVERMPEFYDEHCTMAENTDEPCVGLAANVEREGKFFDYVEAFHGAKLLSQAVGDGVTMTEWQFDVTMKGAPRNLQHQVAVRRWKDGKVVAERFYHK
jgi:hypothetical protein